jgi:translation initiation factor 2 subunit 1
MKDGMISLKEYSKTMTRSHKLIKTGKKEVLRVMRVDKEKGYIDLSKKSVLIDDENTGL